MARLDAAKRKYVIIGLAALAFIIGLVLIYVQYNVLSSLRADLEQEELAVDTAQANLNRLLNHRDRAFEYEERQAYARGKIPRTAREDEVLRYIQRLLNEHNLKALDISFENRIEEDGYTVMPLALNLEGDYSGIMNFLAQLRSGNRAVRVDEIIIRRAENGSDLIISLSASTFYRP